MSDAIPNKLLPKSDRETIPLFPVAFSKTTTNQHKTTMELTTTIFEVAKKWAVSYNDKGQPDEERTLSCMLTEMAEFASGAWMPNLTPLFKAVCSYSRMCKNEKELEEAWSVLNALNELDNTFRRYNQTLGILESAYDRHQNRLLEDAMNGPNNNQQ